MFRQIHAHNHVAVIEDDCKASVHTGSQLCIRLFANSHSDAEVIQLLYPLLARGPVDICHAVAASEVPLDFHLYALSWINVLLRFTYKSHSIFHYKNKSKRGRKSSQINKILFANSPKFNYLSYLHQVLSPSHPLRQAYTDPAQRRPSLHRRQSPQERRFTQVRQIRAPSALKL